MKATKNLFLANTLAIGVLTCAASFNSIAAPVPSDVAHKYDTAPDSSISDEFNGSRAWDRFDETKWNWRRTKPSGVAQGAWYVKEKNGKITFFGRSSTKKSGGIVSKQYKKHGFYLARFKASGMSHEDKTVWHPSIWSGQINGQPSDHALYEKIPESTKNWLEIDMVEYETFPEKPIWSSDAPARVWVPSLNKTVKVNDTNGKAQGFKKAIMVDEVKTNFSDWQVWGLEYHPNYLQMWKKTGNNWVRKGRRINFTDGDVTVQKPTLTTIPKAARTNMFWYLGNLYAPQGRALADSEITDSRFEIDYFRFYPYMN